MTVIIILTCKHPSQYIRAELQYTVAERNEVRCALVASSRRGCECRSHSCSTVEALDQSTARALRLHQCVDRRVHRAIRAGYTSVVMHVSSRLSKMRY